MLPKNRRLTTKLLDEVIASGRLFHAPAMSLKAIKVTPIPAKDTVSAHSRFAAVAAKKYFKTAVMRNKMRRRIYNALAVILPRFDSHDGIFNCVLMMKPAATDLDQPHLVDALRDIFVKSRIIT